MWIVVIIMGLLSAGLIGTGALGWRDRCLEPTLGWMAAGTFALLLPAAATGSDWVVLTVFAILLGVLPLIWLAAIYARAPSGGGTKSWLLQRAWIQSKPRADTVERPCTPVVVLFAYLLLAMIVPVMFFVVSLVLNKPSMVHAPGWKLQGSGDGPRSSCRGGS